MQSKLLKQISRSRGEPSPARERYKKLSGHRSNYLIKAMEFSRLTLPTVITARDEVLEKDSTSEAQYGFQSTGAECVNHLANKITMTLFPVGRSFFKLGFDEVAKKALLKDQFDPIQLQSLLIEAEKRCATYQDKVAARVAYVEIVKNLLIAGNVCPYLPVDGHLQAIQLSHYVVRRDLSGNLVELMTVQRKAFSALSEQVQLGIKSIKGYEAPKEDDEVEIYNWILRKDKDTYKVAQATCDVVIKEVQEISAKNLPWIPLMWNHSSGADYGTGHVEDYAGALYVVDFLSEALTKGMALMSDIKYLVHHGATTDIDELSSSPTGEWCYGNIDDIDILQLAKYADMTPIMDVLREYEKRLGRAFLLSSVARRDAERVTTLELRYDAQELETALGGVYSLLAQTFQTPLAWIYLNRVNFSLGRDVVMPEITTGLASLAQAGDLEKLDVWNQYMQNAATWPVGVLERADMGKYANFVSLSLSMELPWMRNDEEQAKFAAAQKQAKLEEAAMKGAERAAPNIANKLIPDQGGNENA